MVNKTNKYLSSHIIEPTKETTTFAGGNPGTDLGQEQQYSGFKAVNGHVLPLYIYI
jgi:hypothetical protein